MKNKFAFTLAEVMIVLGVIGVLTAVLLPLVRNVMPNQDIMKFKKAHNALYVAIRELVSSDKYYKDGDLGVRPNGVLIDGTHAGDAKYFCQTLAEVLNAKHVNCRETDTAEYDWKAQLLRNKESVSEDPFDLIKVGLQYPCTKQAPEMKDEIVLQDGTVIYQTSPTATFGISNANIGNGSDSDRFFKNVGSDGFYRAYKTICIDIDGIPDNATKNNCVNQCAFGYGVRFDGKILNGLRTTEWLKMSIQE